MGNCYVARGFSTREMYEFPNIVNVEVYRGNCPCKCVHCPVGLTDPDERKRRFGEKGMDLSLYAKILSELSEHPKTTLRIHSVGEPLLWEGLSTALKLAHEQSVRSWLFTCAATGDKSLLEHICEHTSIIEVSVNSTTPEDYQKTKGINAFNIVKENIAYMHDRITQQSAPARLVVSRVQSLDEATDKEFVRHWKNSELVDDAFVRTHHTYNDLLAELYSTGKKAKHEPCLVHWARFNISVGGYAVVCFNELFKEQLDGASILGDVNKQTIAEIWQGPKLSAIRKAELSSKYSSLPFGDAPPCKNCRSCQPLQGKMQTSEHQIKQLKENRC